jgi:formylglycine-generating enzyme required for sulfatase activity
MDPSWINTLPEPLRTILIGAAGDFVGGLAADMVGRLLGKAGYQVQKRFRPGPQQAALNEAMAEALLLTVRRQTDDPALQAHYLTLFGEWSSRDAVAGELSQVVDPRPDAGIDLDLLTAEFEAAGYAPDLLGDGVFQDVVAQFVADFSDSAARQPALQGQIEIGLLRGIAGRAEEQVRLLRRVADALEQPPKTEGPPRGSGATTSVTINGNQSTVLSGTVEGNVEINYGDVYKTVVEARGDSVALRQAYLHRALEQTQTLSLAGVDPKVTQDAIVRSGLALAAVYTGLMTQQSEQAPGRRDQVDPLREAHRLSAVELLDRSPRLALLGDPGSGKSTFVNFVTLCLAGEALGRSDANLALLTTPLPKEEHGLRDEQPQPQTWNHGALLPVRVVLRDFAADGLPPVGQPATGDHLWRFIAAQLGDNLADFALILKRALREQGGLVMFDGLDEVPEADDRRIQVKDAVAGFVRDFPRSRFLVTSRTYAYQRQDWKLPGFVEGVLAPFQWGQIERFVDNWYAHWAQMRGQNPVDARGRASLLKATIQRRERLRELAERPLLLTLMASLHAWRGGTLPEKREELYADTVDLLLDKWESPKVVLDAQGKPRVQQESLAEWLRVDRDAVRKLLEELAFEAQRDQPDLVGTADIAQQRLVDGLMTLTNNPDVKPKRVIEFVTDRAGLLVARGIGVYSFPHRTFQEYLAACRLTRVDFPDETARWTLADGDRWREVALLAGAKAARGAASAAWNLAEALCYQDLPLRPDSARSLGALLAAQTLIENDVLARISERNRAKAERVRQWLLAIVGQGLLSPVDRAAAGDALCSFGDDRPGVGLRADGVPDIVWRPVSADEFIMGNTKQTNDMAFDDETPQDRLTLPAFEIGKYPITNVQYDAFVQDGGYTDKQWRHCWTKAGLKWKGDSTGPQRQGGVYGLPNHPAVTVSWYEAVAFSNWLGQKLGRPVSLPSEAQWERAARHTDGRRYPWGEQITPDHANYDQTGIGTTTAVGIFPKGVSQCGALDMSGNVWEWCRTKWRESYTTPPDDDLEGDITRVVRGGSFLHNAWGVRCAVRYWDNPRDRLLNFGFRVVVASP